MSSKQGKGSVFIGLESSSLYLGLNNINKFPIFPIYPSQIVCYIFFFFQWLSYLHILLQVEQRMIFPIADHPYISALLCSLLSIASYLQLHILLIIQTFHDPLHKVIHSLYILIIKKIIISKRNKTWYFISKIIFFCIWC